MLLWSPPVELSPREAHLCNGRLLKNRRFFRFLRLHRLGLFDAGFQQQLAKAYSAQPRGEEPVPPALLAAVTLLQAYTRCSDEDAVLKAETDDCWRMVLDVWGLQKAPFSSGTLSNFRARMHQAGLLHLLLDRTVAFAKQTGDFGYKHVAALRVALDSDGLRGAGKVEDTLNLLGHALRLLLGTLAVFFLLPPERLRTEAGLQLVGGDKSIKAALDLDWEQPEAQNMALRLVVGELLKLQGWMARKLPAGVSTYEIEQRRETLQHVLDQNTERDDKGELVMRDGTVPGRQISLSDPDMAHGRKHENERINGYKKYLAVDLDNDLILAAGVLPANVPEAKGADKLAPQIAAQGPVGQGYIDRAFLDSEWAKSLPAQGGEIICRAPGSRNPELYGKKSFRIDLEQGTVQCPAGHLAVINAQHQRAPFSTPTCRTCPQRKACQRPEAKKGRVITLGPNEARNQRLQAKEQTVEGRAELRKRTKIEHKISLHNRMQGPVARYRGVAKNDFDVQRIAAVQNLQVIDRRVREAEVARARACSEPLPMASGF